MYKEVLHIRNISKSFAGTKVLDNISVSLEAGKVHALMGENGAGKSTLMKLLVGLLKPDTGDIKLKGKDLVGLSVNQILKEGLSMVHQELLLVPELTVAENIFLGTEQTSFFWVNNKDANQKAKMMLEELGLTLDPATKLRELSLAQQQMVEIAKAIKNNLKVLILDEPTASLSEKEADLLFRSIKHLKSNGVAVIYISHKMNEIRSIADTVSVLRDGQLVFSGNMTDCTDGQLIQLMVGREVDTLFANSPKRVGGRVVLAVKNLLNLNFQIGEGEVLGLAGLVGSGRSEVAMALAGLRNLENGELQINGRSYSNWDPQTAIKEGIGFLSEDRKVLGFVPEFSVKENLSLNMLSSCAKVGFISRKKETKVGEEMAEKLKVNCSSLAQKLKYLSGGNQQKVVLGKVLLAQPRLIILDEPTRGVDVGAKFEIYKIINKLKEDGLAILLISSEMPEMVGLADSVLVLSKGKQTAYLEKKDITPENILHYAMA
jgi:inositol transport system ATP-binding protein